jgi:hypothetical protein
MAARDSNQAVRSWREVATELAKEKDTTRFEKLAEELLKALETSSSKLPDPRTRPPGAARGS